LGSIARLLEEIGELFQRLSEDAGRGTPIVVEGPSDVRALRELGVDGTVIALKTNGKRLIDVVERVGNPAGGEVIILTDFDRAGREYAFSLAEELESIGLRANLTYWRWLRALVGTFAKDVEGLPSLVETLMRKARSRLR